MYNMLKMYNFCRNNIVQFSVDLPFIMSSILSKEMEYVYVLPSGSLGILESPHLWQNDRCAFRVLDERLRIYVNIYMVYDYLIIPFFRR